MNVSYNFFSRFSNGIMSIFSARCGIAYLDSVSQAPYNLMVTVVLICNTVQIMIIRKAVKELFEESEEGAKKQEIAASSWEDFPEDGYFGMYTHFSIHETMLKVSFLLVSYMIRKVGFYQTELGRSALDESVCLRGV